MKNDNHKILLKYYFTNRKLAQRYKKVGKISKNGSKNYEKILNHTHNKIVQIKTMLRYCLPLIKLAKILKFENILVGNAAEMPLLRNV